MLLPEIPCDGILSRAKAIRYRAPYTTNADFRKAVNNGEIAYNDIHFTDGTGSPLRFHGKSEYLPSSRHARVTPDGKIYLTAAGGIAPTVCRLADQIIVELNAAHSKMPWVCTTSTNPSTLLAAAKSPSTNRVTVSACPTSR